MRTFVLLVVFAIGCARYTWVPEDQMPECRGYRRPRGSTVTIPAAGVISVRVEGRVIDRFDGRPVRGAKVVTDGRDTVTSDSTGRFVLNGSPSGRHVISVRTIGFEIPSDTVDFPLPASTELEVRLERAILDGPCGGIGVVRVRKPWWKLW